MENLICEKLKKSIIPPRVLLSKFRFIDDQSRYSRACLDPSYMPFYYYLGVHFPCKNLLEIGFGIGLNAGCYFLGCKDTENYVSIQEPPGEYYSTRIGVSNIKQVRRKPFGAKVGYVHEEWFVEKIRERQWDLVLINDKKPYDTHMLWLNTIWDNVEGVICMDYVKSHDPAKKAYEDFCKIKNKRQFVFPTRYGVGLIEKR